MTIDLFRSCPFNVVVGKPYTKAVGPRRAGPAPVTRWALAK